MGAKPLWPANEPWPTCTEPHDDTDDEGPVAAVPLLQLFRRDVQQLPFPEATDLLQVLWCPRNHENFDRWPAGPRTSLYWRQAAAVTDVIAQIPVTPSRGDYIVDSSVLHPEPGVLEYPRGGGYPYENWDWDPITQLDEQLGCRADCTLFTAPGTKVGGWPGFCQDPFWPECEECGQRTEHLLTVSDCENVADSGDRWVPRCANPGAVPDGIDFCHGAMQLFYCARCPDLPHFQWYDR